MIDWLNGKIGEVTDLVQAAFTLAAIVLVGVTWFKTRSTTALLGAALAAGVFLWVIHNPQWLADRVGEETGAPQIQRPYVAGTPWLVGGGDV